MSEKKPSIRSKQSNQISPNSYHKKGRFPFALHPDVRYEKLGELVEYHGAKSASDYLERLIIQEWEKMQQELKSN